MTGFGQTDGLDLTNLAFVASGASATTVSWTQLTSGASASGTLSVSEGGHTANLTLLGQYMAGNFNIQADGLGGTLVTDPSAGTGKLTIPQPAVALVTNQSHS